MHIGKKINSKWKDATSQHRIYPFEEWPVGYLKYLYTNSNSLKFIIEEDVIGFYLIVYNDPHSEKSSEDYLVDSLEEAFQVAKERFGISREQWKLQET